MIDLDDVKTMAAEVLLKDGTHYPLLLIETPDEVIPVGMTAFPLEGQSKQQTMRSYGAILNLHVFEIVQVIFIAEAYGHRYEIDKQTGDMTHTGDNELLVISSKMVETGETALRLYEIVRPNNQTVDLVEIEQSETASSEAFLLDAFVEGFYHGTQSDNS